MNSMPKCFDQASYVDVKLQLHKFLTIALYRGERSASCSDFPCKDWIESSEAPNLVWSFEDEKNLLLLPEITLRFLICPAHSAFIVSTKY